MTHASVFLPATKPLDRDSACHVWYGLVVPDGSLPTSAPLRNTLQPSSHAHLPLSAAAATFTMKKLVDVSVKPGAEVNEPSQTPGDGST